MKRYSIVPSACFLALFVISFLSVTQCVQAQQASDKTTVKPGIETLKEMKFEGLRNKAVGLVTNPTAIDLHFKATVDILFEAPEVNLVALYGPEHGIRGDYEAGAKVGQATDLKTGLTVFSLYGKNRKPSTEMLEGIDILVFDIQDIGSRSYTYISTLGLIMQAAAENNIEVMVLDRPNPIGGERVEGNLVEPEFTSFVSQFPIPYIHGLTTGELAYYLNGEKLVPGGQPCKLTVIPMQQWQRSMAFNQTKLNWIPTSPHIPEPDSPYFYAMTGIMGELQAISEGVGYTMPFKVIATDWLDADRFATAMNALQLQGLHFRPIHYKAYYGRDKGATMHGVQIHITDYQKAPLMTVQFYAMQELKKLYQDFDPFKIGEEKKRIAMFDKVCGSDRIRKTFTKNYQVADILPILNEDLAQYLQTRKKYLIY